MKSAPPGTHLGGSARLSGGPLKVLPDGQSEDVMGLNVATVERLTKAVTVARMERAAWEDCYTRLNESIEAAHRGRVPRLALSVLQDAAQKASQKLAEARAVEERAVSAYLRMAGV